MGESLEARKRLARPRLSLPLLFPLLFSSEMVPLPMFTLTLVH